MNTTRTARNWAAATRSRRNGVRCFAVTDYSGRRVRIGKVSAAHLRSKASAYNIRQNMRDFLPKSGRRRSSTLATKLEELVADSFRTNGKRAQTIPMINAAAACRFPATSRAGRAAPATFGKRLPPADKGVVKRGHACARSRRTYSSTGPPAGSTPESAERDRWPPPSDRVTKAFQNSFALAVCLEIKKRCHGGRL
jgi:hypothetical protein